MFNYGPSEIGNLSNDLKPQHVKNLSNDLKPQHVKNFKIKMTARKMMTFVNIFFPEMVGDLVQVDDEV